MNYVVVYSGGLDSGVVLNEAVVQASKNPGSKVIALSVNYGSRQNKVEANYRHALIEFLRNKFKDVEIIAKTVSINLNVTGDLAPHSTVPHESYAKQMSEHKVATAEVSNRNGILANIAANFATDATSENTGTILLGFHRGDNYESAYPDTSPVFVDLLDQEIRESTRQKVNVEAPFVLSTKADIVKHGHELDFPFTLSYSCYQGGLTHCGECATCLDRKAAFDEAGVLDPTVYANA